jgi:hypothetical protein
VGVPRWSRSDRIIATAFVLVTILVIAFAAYASSLDSR